MSEGRVRRTRDWWKTAQSSVVTHRFFKWFWVALWIFAELTGLIEEVSFVSRLSLVALILGSWSAEEAAISARKQDEE